MDTLTSNIVFDKAFPKERLYTSLPLKEKELERDVKHIFLNEEIVDYRCYMSTIKQTIYYIVETKCLYLAYKEDLKSRKQIALGVSKDEIN